MELINLHRHTHFSLFDGFGDCKQGAKYAKKLGQSALAITDHGVVTGLINHYNACKEVGIKPILGVEAYFQPEFEKKADYYHITLLAKNLTGYENLMKMISEANRNNFYRRAHVTWGLLEKFNDGIIALSACMGGYISQLILNDSVGDEQARASIKWFKKIFGDDFYLEVMPVNMEEQKAVNKGILRFAGETNTKIVMTNDTHFVSPKDWDTYKMMHKMKDNEAGEVYENRYMPNAKEIIKLWKEMHPKVNPSGFIKNTKEIANKCEMYELKFDNMIPKKSWDKPSRKKVVEIAKKGLIEKDKWNNKYKAQLKKELEIVFHHGFEDYFLLTYEIVKWAKDNNVRVGFGRGSVGDFLLAYAMGITELDTIKLGTNKYYERFLRKDKKKFPDIDIDFDSNRRDEVIDHLKRKYAGKAAQISAFGYYKERNLMNDIAKVLDMNDEDLKVAKKRLQKIIDGGDRKTYKELKKDKLLKKIDNKTGFLKHFSKLYNQIRYIGKHAAGVAITPDGITQYAALQRYKGDLQTAYDLDNLENINVLKMDILGLSTLSVVADTEKEVGVEFDEKYLEDDKVYDEFTKGNTAGVFQFEKEGAKEVLQRVKPDNMQELIACNALNRPAPKELGILDEYVDAKFNGIDSDKPWTPYAQNTYGSLIFQEQVMNICREIGEMNWDNTDKVMKSLRKGSGGKLKKKFIKGAVKNGLGKKEAKEMFENMTLYLFNKGHGAAYSLLSFYCMWLKVHYPIEFYYACLKNEKKDRKRKLYEAAAAQENDIVIMLAHVNGEADYSITEIDSDKAIQQGLTNIKGIGAKTAAKIEKNGPYKSIDDFMQKTEDCSIGSDKIEKLKREAALTFNKNKFWRRTIKYNAFLNNREMVFY